MRNNNQQKKELNGTWLIQRLNKPYNHHNLLESFSFGGGLKNGGLSEDAMKLLRPVFSFDYMGSAEFEFGAIPAFFKNVASNIKSYTTFTTSINNKSVFVIGQKDLQNQIIERINELAENKCRLKEHSDFDDALGLDTFSARWRQRSGIKNECNTIGWLELDNEFMFFVDSTAFEKTASLFGLASLVQ